MRFVCDHDVDARLAATLRRLGHDAWTAADAGLFKAADDELPVYAIDHDAVLLSHDTKFSLRRRRNVIGRHIYLRCKEWDAAELVERYLLDVLPVLERHPDVWVQLSSAGPKLSFDWQ